MQLTLKYLTLPPPPFFLTRIHTSAARIVRAISFTWRKYIDQMVSCVPLWWTYIPLAEKCIFSRRFVPSNRCDSSPAHNILIQMAVHIDMILSSWVGTRYSISGVEWTFFRHPQSPSSDDHDASYSAKAHWLANIDCGLFTSCLDHVWYI